MLRRRGGRRGFPRQVEPEVVLLPVPRRAPDAAGAERAHAKHPHDRERGRVIGLHRGADAADRQRAQRQTEPGRRGLPRGPNRLWTQGGLLYALPMR